MSFPSAYLGPVVASLMCFAWGSPLTADEPSPTAAEAPTPMEPSEPLETVAPETVTAPAGRYLVESLAVDGAGRESVKHVVVSESRLTPGRAYSEADIGQAVRRIKRLAFVLDARPLLRRGSAPGRYQLVFEIVETAHVLLSGDMGRASYSSGGVGGDAALGLGVDKFFGSSSQVRSSIARRNEAGDFSLTQLGLGFTKYDLIGEASRLDLDVMVSREVFGTQGRSANSLSFVGSLMRPVSANQSLCLRFASKVRRLREEVNTYDDASSTVGREGYSYQGTIQELGLGWTYDTTDDPFAALAGTRLSSDATLQSHANKRVSPPSSAAHGSHVEWASFAVKGSRAFRAGTGVVVEPNLSANTTGYYYDGESSFWISHVAVGLNLRLVEVGPRNRNRLFAQASVATKFTRYPGTQSADFVDPARWTKEQTIGLSAGVRTRLAVVSLHVSWLRYPRYGIF
jgi:hypothetical protein